MSSQITEWQECLWTVLVAVHSYCWGCFHRDNGVRIEEEILMKFKRFKFGKTRGDERRRRIKEWKYLRRYGYIQEWRLQLWRFRRRKEEEHALRLRLQRESE